MNIVIRADAAVHIGSGHVMRCLTLADELRERGARVTFICRDWEGHLERHISAKGYTCILLKRPFETYSEPHSEYASWLGVSKEQDARETLAAIEQSLGKESIDWCIVDHYGIDAEWHGIIRQTARKIMVIDDIANREYDCDVLLDQNLYDNPKDRYISRVSPKCRLLFGPEYALLRPEFREARERLGSRLVRNGEIRRIMVFFGGSDPSNETVKAVKALQMLDNKEIEADVIVGIANPHRAEVEQLCALSPNIHFHCQVPNMADFMMKADIALGAGGSTTWERCCLGLPTLAVIIAENQAEMTQTAALHGLQWNMGWHHEISAQSIASKLQEIMTDSESHHRISTRIVRVVDGEGTRRVVDYLVEDVV